MPFYTNHLRDALASQAGDDRRENLWRVALCYEV